MLPPPPAGIDLTANRSSTLIITSVVTFVLATFAIMARVVSRRLNRVNLWLDDWLILIYLVRAHGFAWKSIDINCSRFGQSAPSPTMQIVCFVVSTSLIEMT